MVANPVAGGLIITMVITLTLHLHSALADVSHLRSNLDYTITPSSQVAYYHYPAPPGNAPQFPQRPAQPLRYQHQHQHQHQYRQQQQHQHQYQQHQARAQAAQVVRQFTAPSLERAAFTQALSSQGYVFGGHSAASAPIRSAAVAPPAAAAAPAASAPASRSLGESKSLNVKLPVPFGTTPLNIAQLPLQAGAPYNSVSHTAALTSYGTPEVQRR